MFDTSHLAKPKDGPAPRWFHVAVAASMVISALAALAGTLLTGRTMSALVEQNAKLVRAGSTPVLEFGHGNRQDDGSEGIDFVVRNVGSGLARVVWFELTLDGKPMSEMSQVLSSLDPPAGATWSFVSSPIGRRTMAPGSEIVLFLWNRPPESQPGARTVWAALDKARFSRVKVQACFCSVFDDCWLSALDGEVPKPVPRCEAQGHVTLRG